MDGDRSLVIRVDQLSRRFGRKLALDRVSLEVPAGVVFGLVGLNGAGKTTLLKHIVGLLRAEPGRVWVLGDDPARAPERVLRRIGLLTEEDSLPGWMRVGELIRFYSAFYPSWDASYADELIATFGLHPADRLANMSKGQRARSGLLIALAHRPELLVLDEPSSGLDPVVRGDILEAIIRTIAQSGRTVLFSSHLLDEVQRVSDYVALVHHGQILECGETAEMQTRFQRVTVRWPGRAAKPAGIDGAYGWQQLGPHWSAVIDTRRLEPHALAARLPATLEQAQPVGLHDWFVARVSAGDELVGDGPANAPSSALSIVGRSDESHSNREPSSSDESRSNREPPSSSSTVS